MKLPDPHTSDDEDSDNDEPSAEELAQIGKATPQQATEVDQLLLSHCTANWRKVAMVVGSCLDGFDKRFPDLPYVYMQVRLLSLVDRDVLEAQGDVMAMRFSEVRLRSEGS